MVLKNTQNTQSFFVTGHAPKSCQQRFGSRLIEDQLKYPNIQSFI